MSLAQRSELDIASNNEPVTVVNRIRTGDDLSKASIAVRPQHVGCPILTTTAMQLLRSMCGESRKDRCRNSDVRDRCGFKEDVVDRVERVQSLLELAELELDWFPCAVEIIMSDIYVDDIISGGSSLEDVRSLQTELIKLMVVFKANTDFSFDGASTLVGSLIPNVITFTLAIPNN
ncbi:hypothetical protein EVAR_59598_1 [Eumeta japonica]|uniref:Uncharacterized protein n=1 Tax=Eumeta variegata TaxID=151549 RepID=A0A4C1Z9A3_EUMVA|nr:hypothetical protein EVAR_59598_1 [Eumeta japonica]